MLSLRTTAVALIAGAVVAAFAPSLSQAQRHAERPSRTAGLQVVSMIEVGGSPSSIIATPEAIWVSLGMDGVARIDPKTSAIVARIEPGGAVIGLAAGFGAIWAVDVFGDRLLRIDPATNQVTQEIRVGGLPNGLTVGHGSVWVQNQLDSTVQRVEPRTGRVTATIRLSPGDLWPGAIVTDRDGVWIVMAHGNGVGRIDPETSRLDTRIPVLGARSLAVTRGSVWVGRANAASLARIAKNRILHVNVPGHRFDGYGPTLAGGKTLWLAARGSLVQVDPRPTDRRVGFALPKVHDASSIVVTSDVWVADQTAGRIVRLREKRSR